MQRGKLLFDELQRKGITKVKIWEILHFSFSEILSHRLCNLFSITKEVRKSFKWYLNLTGKIYVFGQISKIGVF